jgi:hypothetical protein
MKFETPLENRAGQVVSVISLLAVGVLLIRRERVSAIGNATT